MNEPEHHAFRIRYPTEWIAFTHFDSTPPFFESLTSYTRKRTGDCHLFLVSFAEEAQLLAFEAFMRALPSVTEVSSITEDEFHAAPPDHTWSSKRYRSA